MKKMLSFGFATLFALVGTAEEIESSTIASDIENDYGQNPYGTVCQMSAFLQKTATLKWCSLGTSITWYNDEPRPEVGLTHGYQDRTIEKLGLNKAANFLNRGVSGARIGDANTEPPSGSPCDIYTLEWGINDWMRGTRVGNIEIFRRRLANPNDTCADITTEVWYTFAASYARVITQIKAINPDAIIILMTPRKAFNNNNNLNNSMAAHWWDKSTPDSAQQEATYLYDYVKLIRAIGEEIHCPVVDQFRYAANVENLESLSIDKALHPNDAGYEVMANLLAPVMSKAIEERYSITRCTHEGTTSVVPGTAATCTSDGTTDKTVCTNPDCQMVLIPSEAISALGHDWGEWAVMTPATESATGLKERTCQRAGCNEKETQIIPCVGEIVALRNIAVVTKVGELPALPAQVAGLRADGTVAGMCDVVWAEHDAPSAVGRTTITGTATIDNEAMTVTASVRATVEQSDDDIKNIVLNVPPTKVYPMSGITYPYAPLNATTYANQVNGRYENNSFPWSGALGAAKDGDYNGKYAKEVFVFEFTLAKTSTVKGFTVWHMTDSGWLEDPYPAFVEVSTDNGTTWTSVAVTGGARPKSISAVTGGNVYKYNYELASPAASVTKLRLKFSPYGIETPEPGDSTNWKGLKISEIEVFGIEGESGGPLEPLTTDTLSALEVDKVAVQGFASDTFSYTVDSGKVITKAENDVDNVAVTILPKDDNDNAYVVTLSESGSTKIYTVTMAEGEEPPPVNPPEDPVVTGDVVALRNVAVVTAVGTAPTLPETVKGLNADGTLAGDYSVDWQSVTPAEAGVTTVSGTATVEGQPMSVTAFVRAVNAGGGDLVNVAPRASSMTVSSIPTKSPEAQNQSVITNCWEGSTMVLGQWCTPKHSAHRYFWSASDQGTIKVDFTWPTAQKIAKVGIAVYDGNQHGTAALKYGSSGDPISSDLYDCVKNGKDYYLINQGDAYLYTFKTPISLSELTVEVTKKNGGTWIGIYQIEIFAEDSTPIVPSSTDTLTTLEVDDESIPDFDPETLSYKVSDGGAITKAENGTDNVAVTILPKYDYKAYAVTFAEDGESTKTYTVSMPKSHDHVFGEWQVITPATVYEPGLRRRVCTFAGCDVYEEEVIPRIPRKSVKWINVDFVNYTDGSTIANGQVDPVNGGTWAKPSADDTASVAHGDPDPDLAALVVTNQYLCYAAKAQTLTGRDATIEFKAKFQKPTTDELPQTLDLGQTAVFVFPDGKGSCYKAYTSTGWVKLTGATPDFENFVTIKIEVRYNDGGRSAMVTIDGAECTPDGEESPWFPLAGEAKKLTSVSFFGEFDLGNFWGEYLTVARGLILIFQ